MTLRYSEEKTPLGTAGSVLHALEGDADTVLVLSGDGLMGCDLSDALRFHQRVGAAATLVLKSVDIPLAYGVVVTDERGRILRFIEKPDWSRVVSSQVRFRNISKQEASLYWASGEPQDKAGGYAIQGLAAVFVAGLNGSYSAVVGLPVCETAELLGHFGIPCWQNLNVR